MCKKTLIVALFSLLALGGAGWAAAKHATAGSASCCGACLK